MGNSEVGHLNIGAGRVVYQDFTRIDLAIRDGSFARNPVLADAVESGASARHDAARAGASFAGRRAQPRAPDRGDGRRGGGRRRTRIAVHAFLDGRDTPPRSAAASLATHGRRVRPRIPARASRRSCGRYYAMDRDQRWERVARGV